MWRPPRNTERAFQSWPWHNSQTSLGREATRARTTCSETWNLETCPSPFAALPSSLSRNAARFLARCNRTWSSHQHRTWSSHQHRHRSRHWPPRSEPGRNSEWRARPIHHTKHRWESIRPWRSLHQMVQRPWKSHRYPKCRWSYATSCPSCTL